MIRIVSHKSKLYQLTLSLSPWAIPSFQGSSLVSICLVLSLSMIITVIKAVLRAEIHQLNTTSCAEHDHLYIFNVSGTSCSIFHEH